MAEFHFLTPALTWTRMAQRRRSPYTGNRLILINIWISTVWNHHLQHKRAVVNTLLLRTHTLLSEEVDKVKEIQHVNEALKANNYPDWMLTIPNTGSASRDSEESVNEKRIYASVPYIKGTSERLKRAFKSHEVTLVHKPFNSLRSQLFYVKDKTENLKKCGTVYHLHCEQCDKDYVGETSRLLKKQSKGTSF